jgi:hypothetical protein
MAASGQAAWMVRLHDLRDRNVDREVAQIVCCDRHGGEQDGAEGK